MKIRKLTPNIVPPNSLPASGISMRDANQLLTQYAAYHRDLRNIKTHFVGVPLIVFSVVLSLAQINVAGVHGGWIGILLATAYYIWLDRAIGVTLAIFLVACGILSSVISMQTSQVIALIIAVVIFVVGWIIQFIGHKYEGMKPAFMDDLMGLLIGPMFVTAEVYFLLGGKKELQRYIEARVGPVLAARDGRPIGPAGNMGSNDSASAAS
jgi:uncharacterized membrane protein YGL010W